MTYGYVLMERKRCLIFGVLSLLLGLLVYLFFNQNTYISGIIPSAIHLPHVQLKNRYIESFIHSFLADLLWAASATFAVQYIVELKGRKVFLLSLTAVLGIAVELMQKFNIMSGVFDFYDIIVYVIGSFCSILIIILGRKSYENKS